MVLCPLYSVRNCGNSWREGWKREREGFEYRAVRGGWVSELSVFIPSFNSFNLIALTRKNKKPSVSGSSRRPDPILSIVLVLPRLGSCSLLSNPLLPLPRVLSDLTMECPSRRPPQEGAQVVEVSLTSDSVFITLTRKQSRCR